eukprot:superscaffoldBa00001743_g11838
MSRLSGACEDFLTLQIMRLPSTSRLRGWEDGRGVGALTEAGVGGSVEGQQRTGSSIIVIVITTSAATVVRKAGTCRRCYFYTVLVADRWANGKFQMRSKSQIISVSGLMYDRNGVTKRREAVEESLHCSRAVSQQAEEAAHSPTVRL